MPGPASSEFEQVSLDEILITEELARRPARPADHAAEADALAALAEVLAREPRTTFQRVVELAARLCHADSAGVSLPVLGEGPDVVRWLAVAGAWDPASGGSPPQVARPCWTVLERNAPLLFDRPGRHFPGMARTKPEVAEALLVPFHSHGKPAGTVWVVNHAPGRGFNAEDAWLLGNLSRFASAGFQLRENGHGEPTHYTERRPAGAIDFGVNGTDGNRAETTLADELDAMARLHTLSDRLLSITDLQSALDAVLDAVITLHAAERGTLQIHDPEADVLRYAAWRGFDSAALAVVPAIDRDFHSTCAAAIRTGQRVVAADIPSDPRFADHVSAAAALDYRAAISYPMKTRKEHLEGVVTVHFREPYTPTDRVLHWAELYARLGAHLVERGRGEAALRASEKRLRLALSAARMGAWTWDVSADTHHRDANLNALIGLPAEESVRPLSDFLAQLHSDDREQVRSAFDLSVRHGRPLDVEFRAVRPDGAVVWLRDQGDVLGAGDHLRMTGVCVDVTNLKEAQAALKRANDDLEEQVRSRTAELAKALQALEAEMVRRRELARGLATVQEDERRRVSRDLHDSVGQLLAGLSLALKAVETAEHLSPATAAKLAEASQVASALGKEVHGLAVRLRPTSLDDIGLAAALGQLVAEWSARTGVTADFQTVDLGLTRLPPDVETTLYRIVQEALTNVARHARANLVSVTVTSLNGIATAVIEDDGVGFDPSAQPAGRIGLLGMRERAALVGGDIEIESSQGSGTTIAVRILVRPSEGGER